jgi:uncharacterized protein
MTGNEAGRTLEELKAWFRRLPGVLVAFSGGTDSSLVLAAAVEALGPTRVAAALALSQSTPLRDAERARKVAESLGVELVEVPTQELDDPRFAANRPDRCYHCRKGMMQELEETAQRLGLETIVDGSTADDESDFRPGARAMREGGTVSPLAELGLGKDRVRRLSHLLGLETADVPSGACLASRIPYGQEITAEKLRAVDAAEEFLRRRGFAQVRVRHHGPVARIEVESGEIARFADPHLRRDVQRAFQDLGFSYAAADLAGYREGAMNEALGRDERGEAVPGGEPTTRNPEKET